MPKDERQQLYTRVSPEVYSLLHVARVVLHRPMAEIVDEALREYLTKDERLRQLMEVLDG